MRGLRDPRARARTDAGPPGEGAAEPRARLDLRARADAALLGDVAGPRDVDPRSLLDVAEGGELRDPRSAPEPTDAWQRTESGALDDAETRSDSDPNPGVTFGGVGETVEMRALRDPRKSPEAHKPASTDSRGRAPGAAPGVALNAANARAARATHETVDMRALKDLRAKPAAAVSLDMGDEATHERPTAAPPRRAESHADASAPAAAHWGDAQEEDLSLLLPSLPPQHGSGLPAMNSQLPAPRTRAPLLLDVTPHTLNVETVDGFCEALIERNAPIPTEQTRIFGTSQDQQRMVSVRVSQGESRRTEDNHVLGHIELIELRRAPRGEVQIAVTFVIDADGTLSARAVDEATGRSQELRVRLTGAIEPDELERMRAAGRKRST